MESEHPRLTTEDLARFKRDGYLIVRGVLDPELMARARQSFWEALPPPLQADNCRMTAVRTVNANVNALHAGRSADVAGASAVHGTEVSVRPRPVAAG